MKLVKNIKKAKFITHSGTMHADDIFATAFLDLLYKDIKVFRTTSVPNDLANDILVYDIGRGEFDHHQENAKKRENGITYCSFGLLWNKFGRKFLEERNIPNAEEVFTLFDKDFIEAIDADDNGLFPRIEAKYRVKTLSDLLKLFNPKYKSGQRESVQFQKAVSFAKIIIEEELLSVIGKLTAKTQVLKALEKKENHTLFLEEYMPYEQTILNEETAEDIYFVVYPSNRGGYGIKTVPKSVDDHTKRFEFPEEWAGLEKEELEKVSGISGITFCHPTRFLTCCNNLETSKKIIAKALENKQLEECKQPEETLDKTE